MLVVFRVRITSHFGTGQKVFYVKKLVLAILVSLLASVSMLPFDGLPTQASFRPVVLFGLSVVVCVY